MQPTWHERQSAYVTAVKAFVIKLGVEPDAVEIKFCRSFRTKPKLFLDVECGSVAQYVFVLFNMLCKTITIGNIITFVIYRKSCFFFYFYFIDLKRSDNAGDR